MIKLEKKQRNVLIVAVVFVLIATSIVFIQFIGFQLVVNGGGGGGDLDPPTYYDSLPSAPVLNEITPNIDPDGIIELSWSASTRVWYYNIYRRSGGVEIKITGISGNSYTDSTSKEEGKYYYRIEAVNNIGNVQSNEKSVTINILTDPLSDDDPPVEPVLNMIAGPSFTGEIHISWNSVPDADDYGVYRSDDGVSYDHLGIVYTNSYDDLIEIDGTYYYKLKASNDGGTSVFSNIKNVIVDIPGVPDVPEAYTITYEVVDSGVEIIVTWSEVVCNSYNLYRLVVSDIQSTGFVLIEEDLNSTSYSTTLTEEGRYTYKISAVNDIGESEQSNPTVITLTGGGVDEPDDYTWLYVLLGVLGALIGVLIFVRSRKKKTNVLRRT